MAAHSSWYDNAPNYSNVAQSAQPYILVRFLNTERENFLIAPYNEHYTTGYLISFFVTHVTKNHELNYKIPTSYLLH